MLENIQALASNPVGMMLLLIVGGHIAVSTEIKFPKTYRRVCAL